MARLKRKDLTPGEKREQLQRLRDSLRDWGTWVYADQSFEWFIHYEEIGGLPFPGSWVEQPRYVQEELHQWTMLRRWHELNEELPDAGSVPVFVPG